MTVKKRKVITEREAEKMYEIVRGFHTADGKRYEVSGRGLNLVNPRDFDKNDWDALIEMNAVAPFVADEENDVNG